MPEARSTFRKSAVIPDAAKRRSGIHARTLFGSAPAWIPGQARDDGVFPRKIEKRGNMIRNQLRVIFSAVDAAARSIDESLITVTMRAPKPCWRPRHPTCW